MKLHRVTAVFLLLLYTSVCHASETVQTSVQQLPAMLRNELLKNFPSFKGVEELAFGDVSGDGVEDVAAIIQYLEGGAERNKIAVLFGSTSGRFALSGQSAAWEPHMRRMEFIEIKRRSIRISASTTSYTDYESTSYVFSSRDGAFILIGLDHTAGKIGDDSPNEISANFLTNKVIESRMTKRGRSTSNRALSSNYRMPLQKFSLEDGVNASSLR